MEKRALEAATGGNYRPAAAELARWLCSQVSAWLIWRCVQFHGAKLCDRLSSRWWADRAPTASQRSAVVVSELDSTYLKAQQRARAAEVPVGHFPVHLGLQYTGRKRRSQRRGSTGVTSHTLLKVR